MEELLSKQQVADLEKVSTRFVDKLCGSKRHPLPIKLGRSVRWRRSDIERFIRCDCDMARFKDEAPESTP